MKYTFTIYSLYGNIKKKFDTYEEADQYGSDFVIEKDWTAFYEIKKGKSKGK